MYEHIDATLEIRKVTGLKYKNRNISIGQLQ